MSYSPNSLEGVDIGDYVGDYSKGGVLKGSINKGDTWSLDPQGNMAGRICDVGKHPKLVDGSCLPPGMRNLGAANKRARAFHKNPEPYNC